MTGRCKHERCFPDTTCALGFRDRRECECWVAESVDKPLSETEPSAGDFAWNSYSLGTSDLAIIAGRGRPVVVGLIGAPDSGKTSLIAFLYMWLLKYGEIPGLVFAGSWTLGGWESTVHNSRWSGEPPPSFPPHTSSSGRFPGLLHLRLRGKVGVTRDVLITDAPGEWFVQWAKTPNDTSAAGARWVVEHSDVLLLLADRGALSGIETLPTARRVTRDLIERVGAAAPHIPLVFAWTKRDIDLPKPTREIVENARKEFIPKSKVLETTIRNPETIVQTFSLAICLGESQRYCSALREPQLSNKPFLAFRGHYGNS